MPDITIIKLKIRRGTDAQRRTVVLEQGELGYAVDTGRVFIGDGLTKGGNTISPIFHLPINTQNLRTSTNATQGDIVNEAGSLYQLTGTNYRQLSAWTFIGTETDNTTIEYVNKDQRRVLQLKDGAVGASKLAADVAYGFGGLAMAPSYGLSANVDNSTLKINTEVGSNLNQIRVNVINNSNISPTSFYNGIIGGGTNKIGLNLMPGGGLGIDNNQLKITSIPIGGAVVVAGNINFDATFNKDKGILQTGGGLIYARYYNNNAPISFDSVNGALGLDYNTSQFSVSPLGQLTLVEGNPPTGLAKTEKQGYLQSVIVNANGRVTSTVSTVIDILSCFTNNPGLTSFNGNAQSDQTKFLTGITAKDSFNNTVSLSSAGFLSLSGITTQQGEIIPGKIAIPIYLYT